MTTVELELVDLRARVERLEATVQHLAGRGPGTKSAVPDKSLDQEQLLAWLKAEGLVIEPPTMAREHAARWEALSEEEKRAACWELDHLPPGPMVSEIVIENRR